MFITYQWQIFSRVTAKNIAVRIKPPQSFVLQTMMLKSVSTMKIMKKKMGYHAEIVGPRFAIDKMEKEMKKING